jgi:hypothetical protein
VATEEIAQTATVVDDKTAEVALALFDHIEDQINRTDNKAQVILAAGAVLLGWFGTQSPTVVQALVSGHAAVGAVSVLLIALVFLGFLLSIACGLVVIWPRKGRSEGSALVYFGGIAHRTEPEFIAAFLRQSREQVTQNVLAGVHAKSRIAEQKLQWVSRSVVLLLATLVLWILLQLLHVLVH